MLITNSDYLYTNKMMSFAYNRFMPPGKTWRDLFDMVSLHSKMLCIRIAWCIMQCKIMHYTRFFVLQVAASLLT